MSHSDTWVAVYSLRRRTSGSRAQGIGVNVGRRPTDRGLAVVVRQADCTHCLDILFRQVTVCVLFLIAGRGAGTRSGWVYASASRFRGDSSEHERMIEVCKLPCVMTAMMSLAAQRGLTVCTLSR